MLLSIIAVAFGFDKCGLPAAMESKAPLTADRLVRQYHYDSEHFRVWFDVIGINAIPVEDISPEDGIPDWAQRATDYLEKARACLVDTLGFPPPIPDSSSFADRHDVGGDDRTDVYFEDMGFYGMTYLDTALADGSGPAFITIENDFEQASFHDYIGREEEALAVTCAHEFFHAIHYTYGSEGYLVWWMEATAVWSEERNFPAVNDYLGYLAAFQSSPEKGLNSNSPSGRFYGSCLFPIFLTANFGDATILDIWNRVPERSPFEAISLWADSLGRETLDIFGDFARWNLFVGDNYRGFGYTDAAKMPEPKITPRDSIPSILTEAGGMIYIDIDAPESGGLWAEYIPNDPISAILHAVSVSGTDTPDSSVYIYDTENTIPGAWRFDGIYCALANLGPDPYSSAGIGRLLTGPAPSADVDIPEDAVDLAPYPNPFIYGEHDTLYFPFTANEDSPVEFSVWTADGALVYEYGGEIGFGYHKTTGGAFAWIPQNRSGMTLASGIYVYRLSLENKSHVGKFALINR